jgi:hypothetical protein
MENGVIDEHLSEYKNDRLLCQYGKFESFRQNLVQSFDYCDANDFTKQCTREVYLNLLSKGPLVVAMDASFEGFSRYQPGDDFAAVQPNFCSGVNHAVIAVGIITENGEDYLLVRNSWGVNWGKDGYFKLNTKNACGLMDYAWLPNVQNNNTPLPASKCPEFNSQCEFKGKSISTCYGVNDFETKMGGNLKAYKNIYPNNIYMDFYEEKNCQGKSHWNYEDNLQCFNDSWFYRSIIIKSAANYNLDIPWGCIQHFTESCYEGQRTLICQSIEDTSKTGFVFTRGSLFAPTFSIKNVIFFDGIKFTGNGFGMKGSSIVNLNDQKLIDIMARAKSVLINVFDPHKPVDPNW